MEPIPYDKRSGKIWYNGDAVNWADVKIHVLRAVFSTLNSFIDLPEFISIENV